MKDRSRRDALEAEIARLEQDLARAEEELTRTVDEADTAELRAADRRAARWRFFAVLMVMVLLPVVIFAAAIPFHH